MNRARYEDLARRFGTPFYLYDGNRFRRQLQLLRACLPPEVGVLYAVKANPLLRVLRLFRGEGSGAEVASEGELSLAVAAGFWPGDVVYTCPGKTRAGVELALRSRVACLTVESLDEAALIDSVAGQLGVSPAVIVRINPSAPLSSAALKMSGVPSQFGIDEEDAGAAVEEIKKRPRLRLVGVHVYSGTQVLSGAQLLFDARRTLELALRLSSERGFPLELVDLGGGFGVPYEDCVGALDMRALRDGYRALWGRYRERLRGVRVVCESGRFLTAAAGVFVTRVLATKQSRGARFVVCDGGYSHHPAPAYLARCGRNRFPIASVARAGEREMVTVTGPSGTPLDVLARDVLLHRVRAGDLLAVGQSGAYGYTNSCQLFFSGPAPAELMTYRGDVTVLRERGRLEAR